MRFKVLTGTVSRLLLSLTPESHALAASPEHAATPRYLIVNADDLGLSDGVTEGIIKAWREGVVTSTSAMINIEGAPQRVAAAHGANPEMPIGLHLNITTGQPVLPPNKVRTLVDANGNFYTSDTISAHLAEISVDELRAELRAQAELMLASGVRFDHIDYHEGTVVFFTPFFQVVTELAKEYGVPVRQPVPESIYRRVKLAKSGAGSEVMRKMIRFALRHPIRAFGLMRHMNPSAFRARAALLDSDGIPAPNWFLEAYIGNASVENFISMLQQLPPGVSEVPVHPGLVDN